MRRQVYLDYNATQPLRPSAREAMLEVLAEPANASSIHRPGQAARRHIERARTRIGALIGAKPERILFTASATESNATALLGIEARTILVSAVEHPSVAKATDRRVTVPVGPDGIVDLDVLNRMLAEADAPTLVSIMLVNNETGVIQPVHEAAAIVHVHGGLIHSDATQAPGRIAVDVEALGVDLLTLSGHKIGGPQGSAALFVRDGISLRPLIRGGSQEAGRRAGTENVAAIAGFGAAAIDALHELSDAATQADLRDRMETRLKELAPELTLYGGGAPRACNTSCFGAPPLSAETALIALDLAGIAVSSGAACSSGAVEPSAVLLAMGHTKEAAKTAIRVSLGWATKPGDIDDLVENWAMVYRRARTAMMPPAMAPIRELTG
jgi:cysteine desulfurase